MGKTSRDTGKAAEQAAIVRAHGFELAKRSGDAGQPDWDLDHMSDYTQVKRHEALRIPEWTREFRDEIPAGRPGVLVFRRSREPWYACLSLTDNLEQRRRAGDD